MAIMRRWLNNALPFLVALAAYDVVGLLAGSLRGPLHVSLLIDLDRFLFGLPGLRLQALVWDTWLSPVADVLANVLYTSYFVIPFYGAWRVRLLFRWRLLVWGWVVVQCVGYVSYVVFPAAPPWWASTHGYGLVGSADHFWLSVETMLAGPNPLAAFPSLHVAVPMYWCIWLMVVTRSRVWLLWPGLIGWSALYLGHHYMVDLAAGALLGGVVWCGCLWCYYWLDRHLARSSARVVALGYDLDELDRDNPFFRLDV